MVKIKITDSSGREREVEITSKPKVFGRGEDSDYVMGSRSVARHHLKIWLEKNAVMVEDLSGGLGTKLNGEPTTGTFTLPEGVEMEVGAFVFLIPAKHAPVKAAGAGEEIQIPTLHGTTGPTKGLEIELQEGLNTVGRDPESYLSIDDNSVSRQHARITCEAGRFSVIDMHSSNGTFVNGQKMETAQLKSGDKIRFGNLEFRFLYGKPIITVDEKARRKKLMLAAAGGLVGVFLLIVVIGKCTSKPGNQGGDQVPVDTGPAPEIQAETHLNTAKSLIAELSWDQAEKEVDKALDLYPISKDGRAMKKRIKAERVNKNLYEDASTDYDVGKLAEALVAFKKIPKESAYFVKVKHKITELEGRLSDLYEKEGRAFFRANNFKQAHKNFVAYMEINPCKKQVYENWLKKTERALRQYEEGFRFTPYVFNCKAGDEPEGPRVKPEELMRAQYPDKEIFQAMMLYHKGKADSCLQALRRITALSNNPKLVELSRDLDKTVTIVSGKYNEGTALVLQGDLRSAREQFRVSLENDARLMPKELRSFYREDIGNQLAEKLYKEGLEFFTRARDGADNKLWEKAFESWMECIKVKPDGLDCMRGLQSLEEVADEAKAAAEEFEARGDKRALDLWQLITRITRPESLPYKTAQLKLRDYEGR